MTEPSRKHTLKFLKMFFTKPWEMGSALPSSKSLGVAMASPFDVDENVHIVELGPGTGSISRPLLARLPNPSQYTAIDLNDQFLSILKEEYPEIHTIHDSAENLSKHLHKPVDHVVCSLPWTLFSGRKQHAILQEIHKILKPGGTLVTFIYVVGWFHPSGWAFFRRLKAYFPKTTRYSVVLDNVPPAVIYTCHNELVSE